MAQAGWLLLGPIDIDHVGFGSHSNDAGQHLFGTGVGLAVDDGPRKTLIFSVVMLGVPSQGYPGYFQDYSRLTAGHPQTAAGDLVSHHLHAAVVYARLEGPHQIVREQAVLDGVFRPI